ncbi:hypothetical protein BVC80_7069g2 [Macleaya cordata]|uniref:Interactor of constitutive active ROPs n=1 Tax=Macleaya cordata TaxID=56857 RepID=A0A200R2F7_MACCD|nr:hypothetical protein BVC80_7069g2 [Macleaya cordata]
MGFFYDTTRDRVSEVPQRRLSPRPPFQLRTSSSSDSDPLHQRPTVDRSPKLGDRRSPRGSQSDSLHQKKLGTRVTDLESQLGQAQQELKKLKDQLASAECAKKEAQEELEKKHIKPANPDTKEHPLSPLPPTEIHETKESNSTNITDEPPEENSKETDVFEVPMETKLNEPKIESTDLVELKENEIKHVEKVSEPPVSDLTLLNDEINLLKTKLKEKEEVLDVLQIKNESQNMQITEAAMAVASSQAKEEETALKLRQMGEELEESKANAYRLKQQLEAIEGAKAELDSEMKKLRVQTEQWRKAADAAATVLAGGFDMNGRVAERCGSMNKQLFSGGYTGFDGSPLMNDELDDGFGGGKKKGSGIRMFGDLWKKKGQK